MDKIQYMKHPLVMKTHSKQGIEGNTLILIKEFYEIPKYLPQTFVHAENCTCTFPAALFLTAPN